jgi:hypothetical protein
MRAQRVRAAQRRTDSSQHNPAASRHRIGRQRWRTIVLARGRNFQPRVRLGPDHYPKVSIMHGSATENPVPLGHSVNAGLRPTRRRLPTRWAFSIATRRGRRADMLTWHWQTPYHNGLPTKCERGGSTPPRRSSRPATDLACTVGNARQHSTNQSLWDYYPWPPARDSEEL